MTEKIITRIDGVHTQIIKGPQEEGRPNLLVTPAHVQLAADFYNLHVGSGSPLFALDTKYNWTIAGIKPNQNSGHNVRAIGAEIANMVPLDQQNFIATQACMEFVMGFATQNIKILKGTSLISFSPFGFRGMHSVMAFMATALKVNTQNPNSETYIEKGLRGLSDKLTLLGRLPFINKSKITNDYLLGEIREFLPKSLSNVNTNLLSPDELKVYLDNCHMFMEGIKQRVVDPALMIEWAIGFESKLKYTEYLKKFKQVHFMNGVIDQVGSSSFLDQVVRQDGIQINENITRLTIPNCTHIQLDAVSVRNYANALIQYINPQPASSEAA